MMGLGMRFRALVAAAGLMLMAVTVTAVADSKVNSVRLWRAPDNTRLVFDLSGPVQHSVFTLTSPDRLVIDINGATLGAPLNVQTANTPITAMRSAQRTPSDLRVVIDLKKPSPRRASRWRPTRNTATVWWSICSTTRPMPLRRLHLRRGLRRCRPCRSPRPNRPSSCRQPRPASATLLW